MEALDNPLPEQAWTDREMRAGFFDAANKALMYNLNDLDFGATYHVDIAFYTLAGKF